MAEPIESGPLSIGGVSHKSDAPITSGPLALGRDAAPASPTPKHPPRLLDNASDDGDISGFLKNTGSAVIEGIGGVPGAIGNTREFLNYTSDRADAYGKGIPLEQATRERQAARGTSRRSLIEQAPTGAQIMSPLTEGVSIPGIGSTTGLGEYEPKTTIGKLWRAGLGMGISMVAPLPRTPRAPAAPKPSLLATTGEQAKKFGEGAALGSASESATELTGDPLVGAAVVPGVQGARSVVRKVTNPIPGARKMAENDATDLDKLRDVLSDESKYEIVPGSKPTTAQLSNDEGIKSAQLKAALTDRNFKEELAQRAKDQNVARNEHMQGAAEAGADTMAAPSIFARVRRALHQSAENHHAMIPDTTDVAPSGLSLQTRAKNNDQLIAKRISDIYNTLDPEGRVSAPTPTFRTAAEELRGKDPMYSGKHDPLVQDILDRGGKHPESLKFSDIVEFEKSITGAIEAAPNKTVKRQLGALKDALGSDIENMAENVHKQQQAAVAEGKLDPNATWEAALKRQLAEHMQGKQSANTGARTADGTTMGASGVSGDAGATGQTRSGHAPGAEGIPSTDEYMAHLAEQLREGKDLRKERGRVYGRDPVGSGIESNGYEGPAKAGTVAKSAFPGGDNGFADTSAWLAATKGHPEAVTDLQNIAMGRLRQNMKDGQLTPQQLDAWKNKFGTSLKALDEVSPDFSKRFDDVARATKTLADFDSGVFGDIANIKTPGGMQGKIGAILNSADGEAQLANILPQLSRAPGAVEGLRRSAIDNIVESKSFVSADGTIRGDALAKYVRDKEGALKQLFGDKFKNLQEVADDLARAQSAGRQNAVQGSPTEYNRQLASTASAEGHPISTGSLLLVNSLMHHSPTLATGAAAIAGAWKGFKYLNNWNAARATRVYKEALLDPAKMKLLLSDGVLPNGSPNIPAMNALVGMVENQEQDRKGHAAGGAVKLDHAAHAARLVRSVPQERKRIAAGTEPMLKLSDNVVTKALAIANQGLNNG